MLRDLSLSHTWRFLLLSFSAPELVQAQQDVLVLKEALVLARFVLGDKVDLSLFALSIPLSVSLSPSLSLWSSSCGSLTPAMRLVYRSIKAITQPISHM